MYAASTEPALSRRKRIAFAGCAVLLSVCAALGLGEFAVRWHMEGSFLEAVDSVLGLRTAADPAGLPPLVADPDLGFKLNPALDGVNSLGLRYPEFPPTKPAGLFRVVVLGDSVSFPKEGWTRTVDDRLHRLVRGRFDLVNAAVHGYTTYQERRFLERDLLRLEPDLVLVQYCLNDNYRFLHRLTSKGRRLMTLEAKSYLFPEDGGLLARLARSSYLVYAVRKTLFGLRRWPATTFPWDRDMLRAAWTDATWVAEEEHFRAMARTVASSGGALAVVAVPLEVQLEQRYLDLDRAYTGKPQAELAALCARNGIPLLDVYAPFVAHREEKLFTDGLHLTPRGHELLGALVAGFLQERQLVPLR